MPRGSVDTEEGSLCGVVDKVGRVCGDGLWGKWSSA